MLRWKKLLGCAFENILTEKILDFGNGITVQVPISNAALHCSLGQIASRNSVPTTPDHQTFKVASHHIDQLQFLISPTICDTFYMNSLVWLGWLAWPWVPRFILHVGLLNVSVNESYWKNPQVISLLSNYILPNVACSEMWQQQCFL